MLNWSRVDKTLVHPTLIAAAEDVCGDRDPHTWYVLEGYRSPARSHALWLDYRFGKLDPKTGKRDPNKRGPRAAPAGRSAHNFGLAIDVVLDVDPAKPGLQPSWVVKLPAWVGLIARCERHATVENLWHLGDAPHIQLRGWRKYVGWRIFPEA